MCSQTLSVDLNSFILGVSRRNFQNAPELTKTGISLLKKFPAARDAVLEYFGIVFHDAVNISLTQADYENDISSNGCLDSVGIIGPELSGLGEWWAPLIAPWCITLIMDIATKKSNVPTTTLQNVEPIRVLLDITTQNLTLLEPDERTKCIDMMLGCRACWWAVGWVGRAEPALVCPRALALGAEAARAVLAHLAHHPPALAHLRAALTALFTDAIKEDNKPEKTREVISYLLNLASKSDIVLKAITEDIEQTLSEEAVRRLAAVYAGGAGGGAALGALVALAARAHHRCLLLLLRHAHRYTYCRQLLEHLLQKLEADSIFPDKPVPMVLSAAEEMDVIREKLLTGTQLEQYSLARLLILVCYNLPSELVSTVSYLVQYARSERALALAVRVAAGAAALHVPGDAPDLAALTDRYHALLTTAIEWESSGACRVLRGRVVSRSVEACAGLLAGALAAGPGAPRTATHAALPYMPTYHALAEVLDRLDMSGTRSPPPSVETILKVVQATVKYFFRCIHLKDVVEKVVGVSRACRLIRKVCAHSDMARAAALRDLLQHAMFRHHEAFARPHPRPAAPPPPPPPLAPARPLLLHNQRHGPITQLTQSHTSVFHAGVVGAGERRDPPAPRQPLPPILTTNNELLMAALMACMEGGGGVAEGATSLALLLVELVSPDVMYNGLPWPDEDFTKQVSIERELYMRRCVERSGAARAALRRAAAARPAATLASALLRAAAATLLHSHAASRDRQTKSEEMVREQAALIELVSTMTLAQLLPHPLGHMLELIPELTAGEIVQVLRDCLWNYTRDHVPSPALFTCDANGVHWRAPDASRPPPAYTDTLRLIIQKNIATLGHMYPIMFIQLQHD